VCFIAINVGPGGHRLLQCRDVDVPGPMGYLDSVTSNGPSTLGVAGWASDADAGESAIGVNFYVYGPAGSAFGATRTAGARPDVVAAYPWAGRNSGFGATVPAAGEGTNTVCAYAINAMPPSTNPQIGCRDVLVQNAFGYLDTVAIADGRIFTGGWALNPNRPAGPVTVHVYDYGPNGLAFQGFVATGARPDVASIYPGYGANHGFWTSTPAAGAGKHTVCVYAITTDGGAGNPLLGCRDVTVP